MNADSGFVNWLLEHLWAPAVGLVGMVWKQNQSAMKAMGDAAAKALEAHADEDARQFRSLHDEQQLQRGHIAKLFDQMREESHRSEERHRERMQRAHEDHSEILRALNSKADR
jgi:hypothetical protein